MVKLIARILVLALLLMTMIVPVMEASACAVPNGKCPYVGPAIVISWTDTEKTTQCPGCGATHTAHGNG